MNKNKFLILGIGIVFASLGCGKKTELEGTYEKACAAGSKTKLVVSGETATTTQESFSDAACTTASFTAVGVSDFTLGDAVTTPPGAKKLDMTAVSGSITPKSDAAAAAL